VGGGKRARRLMEAAIFQFDDFAKTPVSSDEVKKSGLISKS
jgi:hypothetical protein